MVRASNPILTPRKQPKKRKPAYKFKENKRRQLSLRPYIYIPYAERKDKQTNLEANKRYKKKVREGKTSTQRRIHKEFKRTALRGYHKKHGNMKVCTHCGESKAISDFDLQKDATHPKGMRRPYCYICRRTKNAEAYQKRKAQ